MAMAMKEDSRETQSPTWLLLTCSTDTDMDRVNPLPLTHTLHRNMSSGSPQSPELQPLAFLSPASGSGQMPGVEVDYFSGEGLGLPASRTWPA